MNQLQGKNIVSRLLTSNSRSVIGRASFAAMSKATANAADEDKPQTESDDKGEKSARKIPKRVTIRDDGTEWLKNEGQRYKLASPRNWLHLERPFPKNPWFVPPAPIGDALREQVYQEYLENPLLRTPRKLAEKHRLSVLRIEAILRLKHLEKKQEMDGYVLQRKYSKEMENLLAVGSEPMIEESADGISGSRTTILPAFKLEYPDEIVDNRVDRSISSSKIDEESLISTPESRSKELREAKFKRRSDGNYILALSGVIQEPEPECIVLDENPNEKARMNYIFADISSETEKVKCYVRTTEGTLRTATKAEQKMHLRLFPAKSIETLQKEKVKELWDI